MVLCRILILFFLILPALSLASSSMDWVSVTSDSLKGSREGGYVMFEGNVVVEGNMVLCTDEFKVTYNKNKVVKDVTATGSVRVFKENKKASGDKAVYSKTDGTMIITGNAVLTECQGDVSGDSIVFNIDGSGAEIKGSSNNTSSNGDTSVGRVSVTLTSGKKCDSENEVHYIKRVENASDLCRKSN